MSDEATKPRSDKGPSPQPSPEGRGSTIPRWARDLGTSARSSEETWERINELLHEGLDAPDVIRELKLPESKLRSLQLYARKFGPRRRLIAFATFKDALLSGAVTHRAKFIEALGVICGHAVSTDIPVAKQQAAFLLMTEFAKAMVRVTKDDREKAALEERKEAQGDKVDASEVVNRILDVYGIQRR